ncbi:MAG: BON domain-containing protein [Bdellovibrionales bacterium]|nr:BON domain-containing protein [Bdellovibrionales bacterium]
MLRLNNLFFSALFLTSALLSSGAMADDDSETDKKITEGVHRKKSVDAKQIDLTVGLEHLESLSYLPSQPEFKGNFRNLVGLSYDPEDKKLRFNPKSTGTGILTVHDSRGVKVAEFLISVKKSNLNKVANEIKSLLSEIEGIQVKVINNRVVVDGEVLLPKDISRIQTVVNQFGDNASSIVRLSPIALRKIAEIIERDINDPEIRVRAVNGTIMLEGVANDEGAKAHAELIAKTFLPDVVQNPAKGIRMIARAPLVNMITLRAAPPPEPNKIIQIVVHYVELKKDYTRGFRFQWTPSLQDNTQVQFQSGGSAAGGLLSTITGTVSNLLPKLNYAKEHGHARVLQSSSVITENGTAGRIKSETNVPFQVAGAMGALSTQFVKTGILTDITPTIISANSDSIQLKINFKLSALLGLSQAGPLTSDNVIETLVTVRSGQSAAIGGLVSNSSGVDYNKLPQGGGANPILSLFASKNFRRDQSQFVVFVTPVIKSSASAGAEQVKKKFRLRD